MNTVGFTRMDEGTADDYRLLAEYEAAEVAGYADRVLAWLRSMDTHSGYQITRLGHSLQAATRAHRAGEDEEMVVVALLHDVGDVLAPINHSEVVAAMLRPYISEKNHWIVKHHGAFQSYYYGDKVEGVDKDARDRWKDHEWYDDTVAFCENYDQVSFDPEYPTETLEFFEPMVRRLFAKEPTTQL